SFQLFPDDLDRLEWYIEDAMARVPLLAQTGISKVINGPIPYAPDGFPLVGPMPGVKNAFEACVFTFGIAQAGGAGKVLAEWIIEGSTDLDMWAIDPRRFTGHADQDYCNAKGLEVYCNEYAMHFPYHEWPQGRNKKLSPVHERILADGGQMGCYNGWERANWFAKDGDDTSEAATETWDRDGPWEVRVREECEAVRDGCGILDLPGFSRFALSGKGAGEWLLSKIAGQLPKVGRVALAYFPDHRGRIITEMSVLRHDEDEFTLITAAPAQWHDFELLDRMLPDHLTLTDRTDEISTLIVCGPNARTLLSPLAEADLSRPWLSHQQAKVAGRPVTLARVCFAGELGWEIHAEMAEIPAIYVAVRAAGAVPFGMFALDRMRIEKGYRAWKGDLSTDYTLLEAGLDRFIRFDKPQEFPGRGALLSEKQRGVQKRFVTLKVDAGAQDTPAMSSLYCGGEIVGEATSGGWGYRVGASLALAMVRTDRSDPGTALEVDIFGKRFAATVQPDGPAWDPENARLRA
ncbi:MAG: FAD-dependent oxidoreductase, partial [Pseudomonadota bacterium]